MLVSIECQELVAKQAIIPISMITQECKIHQARAHQECQNQKGNNQEEMTAEEEEEALATNIRTMASQEATQTLFGAKMVSSRNKRLTELQEQGDSAQEERTNTGETSAICTP